MRNPCNALSLAVLARRARGARLLGLAAAAIALLAAGVGSPAELAAQQTGRITGIVTSAAGAPLPGAQVGVVGTRLGALSDSDGRFRVANVPAGTYDVQVQRISHRSGLVSGVVVRAGADTDISVALEEAPTVLGGMVVSASRRAERITDAPATITAIGPEMLEATVGNTAAAALKEVKGLDFIQVGMTSVQINARGFNSSFNSRMLMMEDGRVSIIPESGLPAGALTPSPKIDLAAIEVLVGPGSALYGADAANGVISLRTKDPRDFPGATVEVTGGNRSYRNFQGRYAGMRGDLGFKVSGEYQQANDWENYLHYNAGGSPVPPGTPGAIPESELVIPIDWDAKVLRGHGAVVWYNGANRLEVSGGMSKTDGVAQTNVGRNQLSDWKYRVLQARYSTPRWYFNAYQIQSQSGESFALNRLAATQQNPANDGLTPDEMRRLSDWPSDGRLYAAEVQGNYTIPALRNTLVVFGGQYRDDVVSSDRQWLSDRATGSDVSNDQYGFYAQTTTPAATWLDVVLASRLDYPSSYESQWSPKAGLVVKPWTDQAFRVTFNRAFKSPTILQTNFFIPDWTPIVAVLGNADGFTVRDADGNLVRTYDPLQAESNRTWELGYKGALAQRLYVDGTFFYSKYKNFLSPLSIISNPFAGTWAYPTANRYGFPTDAEGRIVNDAGTPIVLTYFNVGNATVDGVDLGLNYYLTDRVELRGTASTVRLYGMEVPAGSEEATALNTTGAKWTVGMTARNLGPWTTGFTVRNVSGYYFRSGQNMGVIPTFTTLDANLSLRVPTMQNALIQLGVANLFTCSATDVTYQATGAPPRSVIEEKNHGCGMGRKHFEMINMPQIGTMVFLGVRYSP